MINEVRKGDIVLEGENRIAMVIDRIIDSTNVECVWELEDGETETKKVCRIADLQKIGEDTLGRRHTLSTSGKTFLLFKALDAHLERCRFYR